MTDVAPWIEEKIAAHRVGPDRSAASLRQLVSACAALGGRGGTAFGLSPPPGGFPDVERLYRLSCDALGEWLSAVEDHDLRSQLVELIRRNHLDVQLPSGVSIEPEPRRRPTSDALLRVVERLEAAGCRISLVEDAPVPAPDDIDALVASIAPAVLPDSLRTWITQSPTRVALEWVHEATDLAGSVQYELAAIPELHRRCAQRVDEWIADLEHYYGVWATASPFLETPDGQGFVAVGPAGEVLHLDDEGDTELNGLQLAAGIEEFWRAWEALGFVALDVDVLERIRVDGFGVATPLGQRIGAMLGDVAR